MLHFWIPFLVAIWTPLLTIASPFSSLVLNSPAPESPPVEPESDTFWLHIIVSCVLVVLGGVFAGLTLGLMGLDELHLRVLSTSSDDPKERQHAHRVLKLMSKGRHWVLVVLLLSNVVINESLPIFLDSAIGGGIAAVVISTTMIVIFGIIPQAVCAKYGLSIGSHCAPFVLTLMYILAPIAWPIAKLLDWLLGSHDEHTYKKAELKTFLQFHREGQEPLQDEEINILSGVLELNEKSAAQIMTPWKDVVTVSADTVVDRRIFDSLLSSGYSRFPVTARGKPNCVVGLLLIKKLLHYDPAENKTVDQLPLSILPEGKPTISCFQALDYFRSGRSHLLLLTEAPGKQIGMPVGVVTLEDVIEEIIGEEIVDETDRYESNESKILARRKTNATVTKGIFERAWRRKASLNVDGSGHPSEIIAAASPPRETQPLLPSTSGVIARDYGTGHK